MFISKTLLFQCLLLLNQVCNHSIKPVEMFSYKPDVFSFSLFTHAKIPIIQYSSPNYLAFQEMIDILGIRFLRLYSIHKSIHVEVHKSLTVSDINVPDAGSAQPLYLTYFYPKTLYIYYRTIKIQIRRPRTQLLIK